MDGFTLIEILVAVMIFGVIMLTVFSSFRSFMLSDYFVKTSLDQADIVRNFTARSAADIKSIRISLEPEYKKPEFDTPPDRFRFYGDENFLAGHVFSRLRFVSLAHIAFGNDPKNRLPPRLSIMSATIRIRPLTFADQTQQESLPMLIISPVILCFSPI